MNKYLIISFKSRNDIYYFSNLLKRNAIQTSIINTPQNIGSSCMLSIKTELKNLNLILKLINKFKPSSFLGLYSIQHSPYGEQTFRLL